MIDTSLDSGRNQPGSEFVIGLEGVQKKYQLGSEQVAALRGVDLQIAPGRIAALTGKSGAGKSTLLNIIGTLDTPSTGRVILRGTDVTIMDDRGASAFRNGTVGFVFQMNNLLNEFSALENVMMPGLIAKVDKGAVQERSAALLKAVGLDRRMDHRPGELSGGEQQRVAIARALVMAPPILLADEPTGNLDRKNSQAVEELLLGICKQNNVTMLIVTHDMELAARMPAQIVMDDGRIVSGSRID